jgi:hypothetical protein
MAGACHDGKIKMNNITARIRALSPTRRKLFHMRLEKEGLSLPGGIDDGPGGFTRITPVEEKEYYPLSSVQKRLFMLHRMEESMLTYNVTWMRVLEGKLDGKRLEESFKAIVKRHEPFRTSFEELEGEPVQRVHQYEDVQFEVSRRRLDGPLGEDLDNRIARIFLEFVSPFDLSKAPLLRVGVVELVEDRQVLMLDMHHIISDLASKRVLLNEFFSLYQGEPLPALRIQYKDFAQWRNSDAVKADAARQEKYWLSQFTGEIPVLNLPTDYERPAVKTTEGSSLNFEIPTARASALKTLALKENTTLFVVMLCVYCVLLSKISRQQDIIVGTPIAGRRYDGLDDMIGMFVNTLALRNHPAGEKTFLDFLKEVKQRTLDAFENQDYQFEDLVNKVVRQRDMSRNPVFDAFYSFTYPNIKNNGIQPEDMPDREPANVKIKPGSSSAASMFDLYLVLADLGNAIFGVITYSTRLFKRETIERYTGYLEEIISAVCENNRVTLNEIKISHDLGTAAAEIFQDEEDDFGF